MTKLSRYKKVKRKVKENETYRIDLLKYVLI